MTLEENSEGAGVLAIKTIFSVGLDTGLGPEGLQMSPSEGSSRELPLSYFSSLLFWGGQEHPGRARGTQGKAREGVPRAPWGPPGSPVTPGPPFKKGINRGVP